MTFFPEKKGYSLKEFHEEYSKRLSKALSQLDTTSLDEVYLQLAKCIKNNSTIFSCGNGGSSSIAEHLACDFVKGVSTDSEAKPKVFPLLSTPILTAIANDISYEEVFAFQVERYAKENDILLSVSSSGNSENVVKAIEKAKSLDLFTISFVAFDGGRVKKISDLAIHVEVDNYGLAEDVHHALMHIFAQFLRLQSISEKEKIGKIKF